ncbi:MAG: hypothetical protein M1817_003038 [Caeruleum heppii]|nr:MAG: hypothetical protein M1817_003038 [Caeruleum heppii]
MAATPESKLLSRLDDDLQDSSAPGSGVATPRPDLSDKRLPGIMHSFFGQVGTNSASAVDPEPCSTSILRNCSLSPTKSVSSVQDGQSCVGGTALPTAPNSPPQRLEDDSGSPRLLPHERVGGRNTQHDHVEELRRSSIAYPSPPRSSSPSRHLNSVGASGAGGVVSPGEGSRSVDKIRPSRALSRDDNGSPPQGPTSATLNPLSSVLTPSTVHAAHLSIPSLQPVPSTPCLSSPNASFSPTSFSGATPYNELKRLTAGSPRSLAQKSTPPQTPRSLSNDGSQTQKRAPPTSIPVAPTITDVATLARERLEKSKGASDELKATSASRASAGVGPPKGKLSVKISEAKGLRPCRDPYVVCVFEWNEYISKGPRAGDVDMDQDDESGRDEVGPRAIKRSGSDMGRPIAIPMKSRQSSNTSQTDHKEFRDAKAITDPKWDHEAIFDVVGERSEIDITVYDRSGQESFLGHVRLCPLLHQEGVVTDGWFKLESRDAEEEVTGEIHLEMKYQTTDKKHYGPEDFQILKLIGKGTFGQVYQVRKKDTQRIYAMKVLSKKVIVQKKEVAHTLGERNILVRTAMADSQFIVGLKFSFQTPTDLYLVTDYMSGGELFWHLQKEGKFNEQRARFYIAELILALQHLHQHDIVYRDLKPENILLDANGHVALCDFGLSKANLTKNDTTNTFCGTTEYLAPEVLLDEQGYTKMVDFWSLGVLVFEMCCGWSPFYADDTQQMYKNIAFGKVRFPRDALSLEGRNFVKGLLNRNPRHRLGAIDDAEELKSHAFFSDINWEALGKKDVIPPFKPKLKSVLDTSNFDPEFTNALNGASSLNARAAALAGGGMPASTPLSPGMQANFKGFTFVDESTMDETFRGRERDDLEQMDEDEGEDDSDWEEARAGGRNDRGDRMSGVIRSGGGEEGVFNDGNFDM